MINKTIIFIMAGVLLLATFMTFSFQPKNNFVSFSEETIETMNSPEYWQGQVKLGLAPSSKQIREPTESDVYTGLSLKYQDKVLGLYQSYSIKHGDYGKTFLSVR